MHSLWHVAVLSLTLAGGGAGVTLAVVSLALDEPPESWARWRPYLVGVAALAAVILVLEWTVVH